MFIAENYGPVGPEFFFKGLRSECEVKGEDEWHEVSNTEMFPVKYIKFSCSKREGDEQVKMEEEQQVNPKRNAFDVIM